MIRALIVRILSHVRHIFESTTLRKKLTITQKILIQKSPLPLVHSHSVSYGRFKRRLVDFLSIEYWTLLFYSGQWCFYHILASSVICYWTDNMESTCLIYNEQKGKWQTCLVLLDCSRICARLGVFHIANAIFTSLLLLFFFIFLVYSFSETFFNAFTC